MFAGDCWFASKDWENPYRASKPRAEKDMLNDEWWAASLAQAYKAKWVK
jgi:hypothetical protein